MTIRIGGTSKTLYAATHEEAIKVIRSHYEETRQVCAYYLSNDDGRQLVRFSNPRFWKNGVPEWEPVNSF